MYSQFMMHGQKSIKSISTCFGRLCAHHQEKQLCLCNTWYLLFCMPVIHTE